MSKLPKVFLDTTVLVAAALTNSPHSPNRTFFKLGALGYVDLRVSSGVLSEAEGVLTAVDPEHAHTLKFDLAQILEWSKAGVASDPSETTVAECHRLTKYRPDARVLAAAIETDCDVLVSSDKKHLLDNPDIGPPNTKLVVMSVSEALDWLQDRLLADIAEQKKK
ncbi:MAG: PIN domain-containing protein [Capsulimonas sp.]|uniref:PIN domain-containing protein n=1 Tax=Capsulimonas sp. TaxID=2494211 RepID=UPI00326763FA